MHRYSLPRRYGNNSTSISNHTSNHNTYSNIRHHGHRPNSYSLPYSPHTPRSRIIRSGPSTSSPGPDAHHEHHLRNNRRTLRSHVEYDAGYNDGVRLGKRLGVCKGRQTGPEKTQSEAYRVGYADGHANGCRDGFADGHKDGHRDGFIEGELRGHQRGLKEGFEQGYDQGCSDGFFQLYAILPDSDSGVGHGDTTSPYAGNTVNVHPIEVHGIDVTGSDADTVIHIFPEPEPEPEPEPVIYLTPVSPSAPLVRVASVPNLCRLSPPLRPSSAQARLHYDGKAVVDAVHPPLSTPEPPSSDNSQDSTLPHDDTAMKTDTKALIETGDQIDENVQPINQQDNHPDLPELPDHPPPAARTSPTVFSDLFIFPYQRNPVLVYPSSLSYPTQIQHNDPSQPVRSEYITEAYAEHHQRPQQSGFSIYQVRPGQLARNMDHLRTTTTTTTDSFPHDPLSPLSALSAFPAVFPVTGSLPASPVLPFGVPDHVVYKYAARPYQLARCVRHSLTTCPMCAITPSHSFLGPGESVAHGHVFRPNGILRPAHDYTEADEYTFPVGFGSYPKSSGESSLSETQHPDEADPQRSLLFDPRLDPEVLGRFPLQEDLVRSVLDADTSGSSLPDTFYCKDCGGLAWLKTKRSYFIKTRAEDEGREEQEKESKEKKRRNKRGRRDRKDKDKTKTKTQAKEGADSDQQQYEVALGTSHPSHHASFNESWSSSPSWSNDDTADNFPEESGTTRSLFVQVAVQSQSGSAGASRLAAFFGACSQFNNCTSFDLATATDSEGRLLRELPFERFNRNAPHLAAVALALHQIWTGVLPSHRTAIDNVTRWNSDHSRRKAYRFRAIVVTASAYAVDLFCNDFKSKWQRHLKKFEQAEEGKVADGGESEGDKGEGDEGQENKGKEVVLEKAQGTKSKKKVKRARYKAKMAKQAKKAKTAKTAKTAEEAKQTADQQPVELGPAVYNHDQYAEECDDDGDHDIHDESYDSHTPSSGASHQQYQHENHHHHQQQQQHQQQHQHQHHDETWRVLAGLAESMRDTLDFERPGIGRYVYVDTRDMKRLLPNGVLVHLVSRYMDLLRWHGVHVAFCHARDGHSTEGARELASQACCSQTI